MINLSKYNFIFLGDTAYKNSYGFLSSGVLYDQNFFNNNSTNNTEETLNNNSENNQNSDGIIIGEAVDESVVSGLRIYYVENESKIIESDENASFTNVLYEGDNISEMTEQATQTLYWVEGVSNGCF